MLTAGNDQFPKSYDLRCKCGIQLLMNTCMYEIILTVFTIFKSVFWTKCSSRKCTKVFPIAPFKSENSEFSWILQMLFFRSGQ